VRFTSASAFAKKFEDEQDRQPPGDVNGTIINRRRARRDETLVEFIEQRVNRNQEQSQLKPVRLNEGARGSDEGPSGEKCQYGKLTKMPGLSR